MNLIKLPNLSLIETLNQSEQSSYFEQPLNESAVKEDKELYHFYKVNLRFKRNSLLVIWISCSGEIHTGNLNGTHF